MRHYYVRLFLFNSLLSISSLTGRAQQVSPVGPPSGGTNALPGRGIVQLAPPESHYTHVVDSLLQHVSKTEVPAGLLYDRAMPMTMLHVFNNGCVDSSSSAHFQQAYQELYSAQRAFR